MAATGPACDALICGMRCAFVTTRPFANVTVKLSLTRRDHVSASAREIASARALAAARKSAGVTIGLAPDPTNVLVVDQGPNGIWTFKEGAETLVLSPGSHGTIGTGQFAHEIDLGQNGS